MDKADLVQCAEEDVGLEVYPLRNYQEFRSFVCGQHNR